MSMKDKNRFFKKGTEKRSFDPRIDRDEYTPPPGFRGMAPSARPPEPKDTEKKGSLKIFDTSDKRILEEEKKTREMNEKFESIRSQYRKNKK